MLHAGLDLCRRKVDVCLLNEDGEHLDQLVVPPDSDSLRTLARRIDAATTASILRREPTLAGEQACGAVGINGGALHALWTLHGLGELATTETEAYRAAVNALRHPAAGVRKVVVVSIIGIDRVPGGYSLRYSVSDPTGHSAAQLERAEHSTPQAGESISQHH